MGYRLDYRGSPPLIKEIERDRWIGVSRGGLPFPVWIRLGLSSEGRIVCTGLVAAPPAAEVTPRRLREIPLAEIVTLFGSRIAKAERTSSGATSVAVNDLDDLIGIFGAMSVSGEAVPVSRPGPKGYPPEHFEQVAKDYRSLLRTHPRAPVKELARQRKVSEPTVRRWLGRARDLGYLRDSIPGRAGEATRQRRSKP